jgi:general stress protein 26
VSRRDQIKMSAEEVLAFLDEERTVICATNGRGGWPHLMPLWYVVRDGEVWSWTYASSQKVKNLERDPRATIQVEAGAEYQELRGVMLKCDVELVSTSRRPSGSGCASRSASARPGTTASSRPASTEWARHGRAH